MMGEKVTAEEVVTAVYKLNLHCQECARAIEKPIIRTSGVQKVDIDVESGKVEVQGIFDVKKIHERIEKKSKRKVELISPCKPKEKEEKKEKIEKKEAIVKTIVIKVHMHCENCEHDLKSKILKLKGVHSIKMNREAQTCTVIGTVEKKILIKYIRKKVRRHGEGVPQKEEKKEEEKKKDDAKGTKEEIKVKVMEKKEKIKTKEIVVLYFIHRIHAPQWFSDKDVVQYIAPLPSRDRYVPQRS